MAGLTPAEGTLFDTARQPEMALAGGPSSSHPTQTGLAGGGSSGPIGGTGGGGYIPPALPGGKAPAPNSANPPRVKWNRPSEQWRATADFLYDNTNYKAGRYAPIAAGLKPLDQVLPASELKNADLLAFLEEVKNIKERLTMDDYFRMFPTAYFDTTSAPSPQWVYKDKSGRGEVRFKLQMHGYVENLNPEIQWRITWAVDLSKPDMAPYTHFFAKDQKNPLHISDYQLRYGYENNGHFVNIAYGQAAQNQVAHLVSRTDMSAFVAASRARLTGKALKDFETQWADYKAKTGITLP